METSKVGRPKGRKKTAKVEVLLEPEIKRQFMEKLNSEGKTASSEVCQWIREYLMK